MLTPADAVPPDAALTTFVMVAHGGELEVKAAVLAASLRAQLGARAEIVVAVPAPVERWGELSEPTRKLLAAVGARIVAVRNEIDESYPHGNKISALAAVEGAAAFLDSDMIMLRPLVTHWSLLAVDAAAKPADVNTFQHGGGDWRPAYRAFGLTPPTRTMVASETGERMPPYYNAGFVFVRDAALFARTWVDTARTLDADRRVRNKRPWLDQVALPIAFERLGWTVASVPELLNFPGHLKPCGDARPYLFHYHEPRYLLRSIRATNALAALVDATPLLGEVLALHQSWHSTRAVVTTHFPRAAKEPAQNLL